jgi:hypothetical protein
MLQAADDICLRQQADAAFDVESAHMLVGLPAITSRRCNSSKACRSNHTCMLYSAVQAALQLAWDAHVMVM